MQASWAREAHARTQEDVAALLSDQLPFHFADPRDPRIDELRAAMGDAVYGPDVLRAAATEDYGAIAVEDRLADVTHPVLVLAGRHDRTCPVAAAEAMAAGLPDAELVVFEHSGHMAFVEENEAYLAAVRDFLERRARRLRLSRRRGPRRPRPRPLELVAHEIEALRPERRVLEVEPGDGGQLLGAARAARAQQLEVARHEVLALLEVAAVDAEREQLAVGVGVDVARRADEVRHVGPPHAGSRR